jgi:DNA polymerase-1
MDQATMPMVARMMRNGMAVDRDHFRALNLLFDHEKAELVDRIEAATGRRINPGSGDQVADLLFKHLGLGTGRRLLSTDTGARLSTDRHQLEMLSGEHPAVRWIMDWRERDKLQGTFSEALLGWAVPENGCWRVHTTIKHTRASTGRYSSEDPDLQNIPVRTALGREIRNGFIAPPGCRLVSIDLSQIEMRVAAHDSQDPALMRVFREGRDIHTETAMSVFNLPADRVDRMEHRYPCKRVGFGVLYLVSAQGLKVQMDSEYVGISAAGESQWSLTRCQELIDGWYRAYPRVRDYQELQFTRARRWGRVWDMFGRWRDIPEVRSAVPRVVNEGLRAAGNMPVQAGAAGVIKLGMIALTPILADMRANGVHVEELMQIHDELILEVEEDAAEAVAEIGREVLETVCPLRVPVEATAKSGLRWGDLE